MTDRLGGIMVQSRLSALRRKVENFCVKFKTPLLQAILSLQGNSPNLDGLQIGLSHISTFSGILYRAFDADENFFDRNVDVRTIADNICIKLIPVHGRMVNKLRDFPVLSSQEEHMLHLATEALRNFAYMGFLKGKPAAINNLEALAGAIEQKQGPRALDFLQTDALRGMVFAGDSRTAQFLTKAIERKLDKTSPELLAELYGIYAREKSAYFFDKNLRDAYLRVCRAVVSYRFKRLSETEVEYLKPLTAIIIEWSEYLDFSDLRLSGWQEANLTNAVKTLKLLEEHRIGLGSETNRIFQKWLDPNAAKTTADFSEFETEVLGYLEKLSTRRISNLLRKREVSDSEPITLKNFSHTEGTGQGKQKYLGASIYFEFVDPAQNSGSIALISADRGTPIDGKE